MAFPPIGNNHGPFLGPDDNDDEEDDFLAFLLDN